MSHQCWFKVVMSDWLSKMSFIASSYLFQHFSNIFSSEPPTSLDLYTFSGLTRSIQFLGPFPVKNLSSPNHSRGLAPAKRYCSEWPRFEKKSSKQQSITTKPTYHFHKQKALNKLAKTRMDWQLLGVVQNAEMTGSHSHYMQMKYTQRRFNNLRGFPSQQVYQPIPSFPIFSNHFLEKSSRSRCGEKHRCIIIIELSKNGRPFFFQANSWTCLAQKQSFGSEAAHYDATETQLAVIREALTGWPRGKTGRKIPWIFFATHYSIYAQIMDHIDQLQIAQTNWS